jgi:hypothetical protein
LSQWRICPGCDRLNVGAPLEHEPVLRQHEQVAAGLEQIRQTAKEGGLVRYVGQHVERHDHVKAARLERMGHHIAGEQRQTSASITRPGDHLIREVDPGRRTPARQPLGQPAGGAAHL